MIEEEEYTEVSDEPPAEYLIGLLAQVVLKKRDEAVKARAASGVERRWIEDEDAFDGNEPGQRKDMMSYVTGESFVTGQGVVKRSRVKVNIIRGRCEQADGRFADITLPVDDRNWGLKATPVPDLMIQAQDKTPVAKNGQPVMGPNGQPVTLADLAQNETDLVREKMEAMEREIDDQLTECSFNAESRKVVSDAAKVGTGIMKGPCVIKKTRKRWIQDPAEGVHVLEVVEEHKPFSKRVDYWNVFPDAGCKDDIKRASYIWERDFVLPRELQKKKGVPGYLDRQIDMVLTEEPTRTVVGFGRKDAYEIEKIQSSGAYEVWEFNGDIDADELSALGCDCEGMSGLVSGCIVFVNDKPIKAELNMLDTGDLPYDFFRWTPVSGSVWGVGLARTLAWQDRVITAAWRAMMDNAGDSSGANIVIGEGIEPVDGKWEITGKKLWRYNGEIQDVTKAFAQFQIGNNQKDLQAIIELALRFADIETAMPMAFPAEPMGPPETLGAVELKVDASNVGVRRRVKMWDDEITRPHLTRYYHWNMQYNQKEEIKGDYEVDPRGASILLQRERAAQNILQLMQFRGDPLIGAIVDWKRAIKMVLAAQKVDILKSDEEIEKAEEELKNNPPQDQKAGASIEVAKMKVQGELEKEKSRKETELMGLKVSMETARQKQETALQIATIQREIKMLELAQKGELSLQEIKAMLSKESMKLNTQVALSKNEVAEPPTEPAGRAPNGRSFEK